MGWDSLPRAARALVRGAARHRRWLATAIAVVVAAAVAFRWARRSAGFWGIDDAGITYAAAFEFADHGSLAAYVEGTPVESYSNPLVFFLVAVLRRLDLFDPVASHLRLEMLVFAGMVALVWSMLRRLTGELAAVVGAGLFTAAQLLTPATWMWYGSGLENVWVSAGLVALLWICVRGARGAALGPLWVGPIAFLVALTRPEAPIYAAAFYLALAACGRPPGLAWRTHARQVAGAAAITAILYAGFLGWRRIGYGDWLPNTYYAKILGERALAHNLRASVIGAILPYAHAGALACSALALVFVRGFARIAASLLALMIASLALPVFAGDDVFLGVNRFATPFLAMCHAAFAVAAAVCLARLTGAGRTAWRLIAAAGLVAVAAVGWRLVAEHVEREPAYLSDVTIARVAEIQGGERWEQQMRLGVPYGVAMLPDAGGALLVGGMQLVDDAYLTDFVMAHMGRWLGGPYLLRELDQYQHEERRPDLVSPSTAIASIDTSYLGTRYLQGDGHLLARRDLVEVPAIDPAARPVFDDGQLQVYRSAETVTTAAPGALVRCELIVAWTDLAVDGHLRIRASVDGGDRDEISLRPYRPGPRGIERRALLLGAPRRTGTAAVTLEIARDDRVVFRGPLVDLEITGDDAAFARAADRIAADPAVLPAARRLAWLREQSIPRLGMTAFHDATVALLRQDQRRGSRAGDGVLRLRWNARLADSEPLPPAIRAAEVATARRLLATCPAPGGGGPSAPRIACLGRAVDELRRLGYLGVLARVPELADELSGARGRVADLPPEQRYLALVGLTLADPSRVALQRELLALRSALERYPALPTVTDRAAP